jgi:hypothetical protein
MSVELWGYANGCSGVRWFARHSSDMGNVPDDTNLYSSESHYVSLQIRYARIHIPYVSIRGLYVSGEVANAGLFYK